MKAITLYRDKNPSNLNVNVEMQRKACLEYAKKQNLEVIEECVGVGFGVDSDANHYSDAIANIKDAAETGAMEVLLVYSFYCIGREDMETPVAIQALLKKGVQVISVMEGSFI